MGKIEFAERNKLACDEFDPKFAKEKISIWLDEDIVDEFRKKAKETGAKYQSMINSVLREAAFPPEIRRLDEIISELETATNELKHYKRNAS